MQVVERAGAHRRDRRGWRAGRGLFRRRTWAALIILAVVSGGAAIVRSGEQTGVPAGSASPLPSPGRPAPSPAPSLSTPAPAAAPTPWIGAAATSERPRTRRDLTGVAIPGTRILYEQPATADRALDRVAALGVRWLRFDAAWSEIETAPGAFDWSRVDRVMRGAGDRGLSVLLILGTTAGWARPAGADWNHGPTDARARDGFAAFAAQAARRYRGQADAYEIWNEPNLPGSWAPRPDAGAYFKLLSAAYRAIHDADPGAVVLSGGTGGGPTAVDSVSWHRDLYAAGLRTVSDGVAVHPYPDAPVPASGELAKARRIRALMNANGDTAKALWGTETGAPTGGTPSIGERAQAVLVRGIHDEWSSIRNVGPLMYYTLDDFGGDDREDHFGLLRADGSQKPAYGALRDWAASSAPITR